MRFIAQTAFRWAHQGVEVEHFEPGQAINTDDPVFIQVATDEGWLSPSGEQQALGTAQPVIEHGNDEAKSPRAKRAAK